MGKEIKYDIIIEDVKGNKKTLKGIGEFLPSIGEKYSIGENLYEVINVEHQAIMGGKDNLEVLIEKYAVYVRQIIK